MNSSIGKGPADETQVGIHKRHQVTNQPLFGEGSGDARTQWLKRGRCSDFKIRCHGYTFKAHRIMLISQSPFIDKVIEGGLDERPKDQLDLVHEEKETAAMVLRYMYTGELGTSTIVLNTLLGTAIEGEATFPMVLMMKVHQLADYLIMPVLKAKTFRVIAHVWRVSWALRPPVCSPLSQSLVSVLRSTVDYAMGSNPPLDHIVEQLCWVLVTMNSVGHGRDAEKVMLDETLKPMIEAHPRLGWKLSMSRANISGYNYPCFLCSNYRERSWDERRIQVTNYDERRLYTIKCVCNFQGFCSSTCLSNTLQTINAESWCGKCDRDLAPPQFSAPVSTSNFTLCNGCISAHAGYLKKTEKIVYATTS